MPELVPRDTLRGAVLRGAEGVARALLEQYKQQDDVRWQVGAWWEGDCETARVRMVACPGSLLQPSHVLVKPLMRK